MVDAAIDVGDEQAGVADGDARQVAGVVAETDVRQFAVGDGQAAADGEAAGELHIAAGADTDDAVAVDVLDIEVVDSERAEADVERELQAVDLDGAGGGVDGDAAVGQVDGALDLVGQLHADAALQLQGVAGRRDVLDRQPRSAITRAGEVERAIDSDVEAGGVGR